MDSNEKSRSLVYQMMSFLQSVKESDPSMSENVDVACQCIGTAFGISLTSGKDFRELSYYPHELSDIFVAGLQKLELESFDNTLKQMGNDPKFTEYIKAITKKGYFEGVETESAEYYRRLSKAILKYKQKFSSPLPGISKAEKEKSAEELKLKGNTAIQQKDYDKAISYYTQALEISPDGTNSHIYYSNRAAAYCHTESYQNAIDDCEESIRLSPLYVKAYSRLGLSHFFLENYDDALEAYTKAAELEPGNTAHKESIKQAKLKIAERSKSSTVASTQGDIGGMPDLSQLLGGGGGAGGLAGLMSNPSMMQMAQQMMSNPAMMQQAQQMMSNPAMMQQAMSMMGGGKDGMPDMSNLAAMMGGMNGAGAGASTGRSGGGIPSFSGFAGDQSATSSPTPASVPAPTLPAMFTQLQNDPEMAAIIQKAQNGDLPGAIKDAQGKPELMQKLMSMMGSGTGQNK